MKGVRLFIGLVILFLSGCENVDRRDPNGENLFFDYKITGMEWLEDVTIMLQFREGGPYGNSIPLDSLASIELDGEALIADSSKMTGAYYELHKNAAEFTGKHTLTYTTADGDKYSTDFEFEPLGLREELPDTISREEFLLPLTGIKKGDIVRLLLTDTSFTSDGVDRMDTVSTEGFSIKARDLARLNPGPISMELIKEIERNIEGPSSEGGWLAISYSISRQFYLK